MNGRVGIIDNFRAMPLSFYYIITTFSMLSDHLFNGQSEKVLGPKMMSAYLKFIITCGIGMLAASAYLIFTTQDLHRKPIEFLSDLAEDYGYSGKLAKIRSRDMFHLNGSIYLDYTGSGLYRTSQMRDVFSRYKNTLYANPHSLSPSSAITTELIG